MCSEWCREGRLRYQCSRCRLPYRGGLLQAPGEGSQAECELILSTDIIQEFERILHRKFSVSPSEISDAKKVLAEATLEVCRLVSGIEPVCRDPDDDKILACAQQVNADYIVTGDEDLLVIKRYGAIQIVTPREFESLFG